MNSNHNDRSLEEQLDRHIAALRDEPADAAPPRATVDATLAMIHGQQFVATGRRRFVERLAAMTFQQRLAAAVMITAGDR